MKFICEVCNIDYYSLKETKVKTLKCIEYLNLIESGFKENTTEDILTPLPDSVLDQFVKLPSQKWLDEGISIESQMEFEICADPFTERIIIPIRENSGDLVGIKGRLIDDNDIRDDKYLYLYPCSKSKILYGYDKNFKDIKRQNEVLIAESEKAVIKLHSMGYKNAVGIGGKTLSNSQAEDLLKLQVPLILCLDQDVKQDELLINAKKLQYPIEIQPVYIIQDQFGLLLGEKESPMDNAAKFEELYSNFKERV